MEFALPALPGDSQKTQLQEEGRDDTGSVPVHFFKSFSVLVFV